MDSESPWIDDINKTKRTLRHIEMHIGLCFSRNFAFEIQMKI